MNRRYEKGKEKKARTIRKKQEKAYREIRNLIDDDGEDVSSACKKVGISRMSYYTYVKLFENADNDTPAIKPIKKYKSRDTEVELVKSRSRTSKPRHKILKTKYKTPEVKPTTPPIKNLGGLVLPPELLERVNKMRQAIEEEKNNNI